MIEMLEQMPWSMVLKMCLPILLPLAILYIFTEE